MFDLFQISRNVPVQLVSINAVLENHKQRLKKKLTAYALLMLRALIIFDITPSLK